MICIINRNLSSAVTPQGMEIILEYRLVHSYLNEKMVTSVQHSITLMNGVGACEFVYLYDFGKQVDEVLLQVQMKKELLMRIF